MRKSSKQQWNNSTNPPDEVSPVYKFLQWSYTETDSRYLKWFVVGYNIKPSTTQYLREDGEWCDVMITNYYPNGGTYFATRNEAEIALAKTGATDHTNGRRT